MSPEKQDRSIDSVNERAYTRKQVADAYVAAQGLQPAEAAILEILARERPGKVLDLGVGAGRTTPFLQQIAEDYLGTDYSAEMVARAQANHPQAAFRRLDARDMSALESGSFDFILFSFNGIDYVDDAGRRAVLSEVHRLLKPGGAFAFSTHNLDWWKLHEHEMNPVSPKWAGFSRATLSDFRRYFRERRNHARNLRRETNEAGHSIVNDRAHNFSLMTYYIGREEQLLRLREAGFGGEALCLGQDGAPVAERDFRSVWIYYLARKAPA